MELTQLLKNVTTKFPHNYDHDTNSWYKCYPDMIHNRHMPGVLTHNDHVIVMGGNSSPDTYFDSIEVISSYSGKKFLFIYQFQCGPLNLATISGDSITIVGYNDINEGRNNGCYQIPVEVIILLLNQLLSTGAVS